MNQADLAQLKTEQSLLRAYMATIDAKIESLSRQLDSQNSPKPTPIASDPVTPPITSSPPVTPPEVSPSPIPAPLPAFCAPVATEKESFEFRLGKVWFARIGILLLLTGLVFLGGSTYQLWFGLLGPLGKTLLLLLACTGLIGLSQRIERQGERFRAFAQVLLAGGLSGIFFTIKAAYDVSPLHCIPNHELMTLLLLLWTGVMVSVAGWRRSQSLGLLSIALAYYSTSLNPESGNTLVTGLILAAASVILSIRYSWNSLSPLAIGASYLTYSFWQFSPFRLSWEWPLRDFSGGILALGLFWAVFALGLGVRHRLETINRSLSGWAIGNTMAAFSLGALSYGLSRGHDFGLFSLSCAGVLAVAGALTRQFSPQTLLEPIYFGMSLILLALGIVTHWSGWQLNLLLLLQCGTLIFLSRIAYPRLLKTLSLILAGLIVLISYWNWNSSAYLGWHDEVVGWVLTLSFLALSLLYPKPANSDGLSLGRLYILLLALLTQIGFLRYTWVGVWPGFFLAITGLMILGIGYVRCASEWIILSTIWIAVAQFWLWGNNAISSLSPVTAALVLVVLIWVGCLFVLPRSSPGSREWKNQEGFWIFISWFIVNIWRYLTISLITLFPALSISLIWALVALLLLASGFAVQSRLTRWWGLGILAAALGRILIFDLWQMATLSRAFSFLALAGLFLGIGYCYNRYQDKIRKFFSTGAD